MRIETLNADAPVHVTTSGEAIELYIGDARASGQPVAALAISQAEMVMHALGLRIAQIHERRRRAAEERAHLSKVLHETEIRLDDR